MVVYPAASVFWNNASSYDALSSKRREFSSPISPKLAALSTRVKQESRGIA